jgi:hypothetical protein
MYFKILQISKYFNYEFLNQYFFINYNNISKNKRKWPAHVSECRPELTSKILFFSLRQTEENVEGVVQSMLLSQASPTVHQHRHPAAANCAWGVPLCTADFGLRIEPEALRFTAQ